MNDLPAALRRLATREVPGHGVRVPLGALRDDPAFGFRWTGEPAPDADEAMVYATLPAKPGSGLLVVPETEVPGDAEVLATFRVDGADWAIVRVRSPLGAIPLAPEEEPREGEDLDARERWFKSRH